MYRSMFSLCLTALFLIAIYPDTLAQTRPGRPIPGGLSISGQVRLPGGTVAEFVIVTLESTRGGLADQVRTDRTGKFKFSVTDPGQYRITIRHPGYQEAQREIDLQTASSEYVLFELVADKSGSASPATTLKVTSAGVPAEAQKEYEQGQADLKEKKNAQSGIAHLEKAISLAPNFLDAHLLLGVTYLDTQQWDKAERQLRRTLEIDPKQSPALFALGQVYRHQQKYSEAEKVLQEGLKIEPKSHLGHYSLGQVYFAKGDLAKAGPEVGQALQLKPDFAEAYVLAGNLLLKARNAENALQMFEQYLRLEPNGQYAAQTREYVEKIKKAMGEKK